MADRIIQAGDTLKEIKLEDIVCDASQILIGGSLAVRPGLVYTCHPIPLAHLNAVRRVELPAEALDAAVAEVKAAHCAARSRWCLEGSRPELDRRLKAAGYVVDPIDPMQARIAALAQVGPAASDLVAVNERDQVLAWAEVFCASRGLPMVCPDAPWEALVGPSSPHRLFLALNEGEPVGCGALQVDPSRGVGLLWGGGTLPGARGRGAYRSVLWARIAAARSLGLDWLATYARPDTSGPRLAALGFRISGPRRYDWERGPGAA